MSKSPGQLAYEEDVSRHPFYDASPREHRLEWDKLPQYAKDSWNKVLRHYKEGEQ